MARYLRCIFTICLAIAIAPVARAADAPADDAGVRLYTLDCGRIDFKDMGLFSDTGEYDGKAGGVVATCFLVRHPKGTLLWDTGLGDGIAASAQGIDIFGGAAHETVPVTLVDQLKALGLAPKDVTYVAFSHLHADHAGNANLFAADSTWIVNRKELAWATAKPAPPGVDPELFSSYARAKVKAIGGDFDVFGDGSVRILKAIGHTPGHQVLAVKLKKSGTVILSGDLYHLRENFTQRRIPPGNDSRAETLASFDRIDKILANTHGRLVVQHDPADFAAMPRFPKYLD
jgi:N-acyl homoserine lactone hydrolase